MTVALFADEDFNTMCAAILPDLRRFAGGTKGERAVGDLINDTWLLARKLLKKSPHESILNPQFQQDLLAHLHNDLFKFTYDTCFRSTARFEDAGDDEERSKNYQLEALELIS